MSSPREAAAAAKRRMIAEARRAPRVRYAVVRSTDPLSAELVDGSLILGEGDLILGQWVRRYDRKVGIKAGDTLAVHMVVNGDWLVLEVVSDSKPQSAEEESTDPGGGGGGDGGEAFGADVGDGSSTTFDVAHGLGSTDVLVAVYDKATGEEGWASVKPLDANTVRVKITPAPGSNAFRVVVR